MKKQKINAIPRLTKKKPKVTQMVAYDLICLPQACVYSNLKCPGEQLNLPHQRAPSCPTRDADPWCG